MGPWLLTFKNGILWVACDPQHFSSSLASWQRGIIRPISWLCQAQPLSLNCTGDIKKKKEKLFLILKVLESNDWQWIAPRKNNFDHNLTLRYKILSTKSLKWVEASKSQSWQKYNGWEYLSTKVQCVSLAKFLIEESALWCVVDLALNNL